MKKLMIAAAIVCAAVCSQAASWNWTQGGSGASRVFYDGNASSTLYSTTPAATVYLFCTTDLTQSELLEGLRDNTYSGLGDAKSVATTGINSDSKLVSITDNSISYGSTESYDFYMAVMDTKGNVYLSDAVTAVGQASTATLISFSGTKAASQLDDGDASFSSGAWYSTESVPEPTSGLLLLLGMAGLALKRKHA